MAVEEGVQLEQKSVVVVLEVGVLVATYQMDMPLGFQVTMKMPASAAR